METTPVSPSGRIDWFSVRQHFDDTRSTQSIRGRYRRLRKLAAVSRSGAEDAEYEAAQDKPTEAPFAPPRTPFTSTDDAAILRAVSHPDARCHVSKRHKWIKIAEIYNAEIRHKFVAGSPGQVFLQEPKAQMKQFSRLLR